MCVCRCDVVPSFVYESYGDMYDEHTKRWGFCPLSDLIEFMKAHNAEHKADMALANADYKASMQVLKRAISGLQDKAQQEKNFNWAQTYALRDMAALIRAVLNEGVGSHSTQYCAYLMHICISRPS